MRVMMLSPDFPEAPGRATGGVSTAVASLVEALVRVRDDIEIDVVQASGAIEGRPGWTDWGGHERIRVTRLGLRGPLRRLSIPRLLNRPVHALVDELRPDVVHVQAWAGLLGESEVPSVFTVHGIPGKLAGWRGSGGRVGGAVRSAMAQARDRAPLRHYGHLVAICGHVVQELRDHVRGRWHFIPNAIHPDFFEVDADPGAADPVILQVGKLAPHKNPLATVEAVALLAERGVEVRLRLVGPRSDPAYAAKLDEAVARLGVGERVDFVGSLDRDGVIEELRRARVVALPSFLETAPMVLAESGAAGVPSVAAPAGGAAEMVFDGVSGRLCDPRSPASLADALEGPLTDPELARTWGARMRSGASRYHPDAVAAATADLYDVAVGG